MAEEENRAVITAVKEPEDEKPTPTMSETVAETPQEKPETNKLPESLSFSIWPPKQRTRDAVINRLVETLTAESVLSKRYGTLPQDEALATARRIEDEAFSATSASASPEDDGIEVLQIYSKDISRRMLETVKSRSAATAASTAAPDVSTDNNQSQESESAAEASVSDTVPDVDNLSLETESSKA